jgi:hypothetical protein
METVANYKIKNKRNLGHWDALLEEWLLSIERFSRITDGDVPYWYNERANIGVLAAAAWRCGRIALEEFQYEKIDVSSNGETDETAQKKWNGRCDLWISNDRSEEIVEAKFKWLNMRSEKMTEFAASCLESAVSDAANTKGNDEIKAIGVAFLPVYAKADKVGDIEALEKVIAETIVSACQSPADLVAWCFPKRLRDHIGEKYNNYLPGIILLAKAAK